MNSHENSEVSQEPMEIERISFTQSDKNPEPSSREEIKDTESLKDIKPKTIIRESRLDKLFQEQQEATEVIEISDDEKTNQTNSAQKSLRPTQPETTPISDEPEIDEKKSKLRPLVENKRHEGGTPTHCFSWQMVFFILFPIALLVACITMAQEAFPERTCAHQFDTEKTFRDLNSQIYGQTDAIRELYSGLSLASSGLKIFAIIGDTGVGKSYAAHIISKNFVAKKNVFQYLPPLKPKRKSASGHISVCGCNLIILENLGNRDITEAAEFVEYLSKKIDNVNYCVLIIEVINVHETDDNLKHHINLAKSAAEIKELYRSKMLDVKVIEFQKLDETSITKCIIDAAEDRNITLSHNQIDDIRISLKISDSGCKGALAKVQLLEKVDLI